MFSRVVYVLAAQDGDVAVATSRVATCPGAECRHGVLLGDDRLSGASDRIFAPVQEEFVFTDEIAGF